MSDDLAAFLAVRLDEDEAAARDSYYEGQRWIAEEEGVYRYPDDELIHSADRKADARHIALHDPARVLREVAADRKILAEYERIQLSAAAYPSQGNAAALIAVQAVVKIRAEVFDGHPDYGEDWRAS